MKKIRFATGTIGRTGRWETNRGNGMCGRCGQESPTIGGSLCRECSEYMAAADAKRKENNKMNGMCTACGENPYVIGKDLCQACLDYHARRTVSRAEALRQDRRKLKDEVFMRYGGYICACCGEDEPLFMVIDHVDSDAHWRKNAGVSGTEGSVGFYRWLKKAGFPDGFQVMCSNCNMGKRMNNGVCPHVSS